MKISATEIKVIENLLLERTHVIMDKAYEGNETRQLLLNLEMIPWRDATEKQTIDTMGI